MATFASYALTAVAAGTAIPVNYNDNAAASIQVAVVLTNTPTLTYSIEYTLDNIFDQTITPVWIAAAAGKTADFQVQITFPCRAVRMNVTAYTAGTATMKLLQGDAN
jgi:hypothetical protein